MPPRWMATALHGPSQQGPEFHSKQTSEKRLDGDVILKSESRMKKRGYICLVFNMIDYAHKIETPSAGPRDISHQPVADKHSPGLVNAPQSFSLLRASLLSAMSVPQSLETVLPSPATWFQATRDLPVVHVAL